MRTVETAIVGGGQAGLAMSHFLRQAGSDHVVLEGADRPADTWRSGRWDSFSLVTPNWTFRLPGAEYDGPDPDGFMGRDEIVSRFAAYAAPLADHIECRTWVVEIAGTAEGRFRIATSNGPLIANNVVIATGKEHRPQIPAISGGIAPGILQLHSSTYRSPERLPSGAVLVVGSGESGAQIADELLRAGRTVFLSVGGTGRAPRRYRGKDIVDWLFNHIRFFDLPAEHFPMPIDSFSAPHLTGARGGANLNLHAFARDGMQLLGRLQGAYGTRLAIRPDLHASLAQADDFERTIVQTIDGFIASTGFDAPMEELPQLQDGFAQPLREEIDLTAEGIGSVIWATGYRPDFSPIKLAVFDGKGYPLQNGGVSIHPGLYFAGFPWMPAYRSGMLAGFGGQVEQIAEHLVARTAGRQTVKAA